MIIETASEPNLHAETQQRAFSFGVRFRGHGSPSGSGESRLESNRRAEQMLDTKNRPENHVSFSFRLTNQLAGCRRADFAFCLAAVTFAPRDQRLTTSFPREVRHREWQQAMAKAGNTMQAAQTVALSRETILQRDHRHRRDDREARRPKEGDGINAVRRQRAQSGPDTGTDDFPKVAGRPGSRAAVARFSRPWRLRRLLSAGRRTQQIDARERTPLCTRGGGVQDDRAAGSHEREELLHRRRSFAMAWSSS